MVAYVFSFLPPFFLALHGVQMALKRFHGGLTSLQRLLGAMAIAAIIVSLPVDGLPVARWVAGVNANFSIPLTAMLFCGAWEKSFGFPLMGGKTRRAAWSFGLVGGGLLYPMALGLGSFDPYELGYGSPCLFMITLSITLLLLLMRNGFGVVLVASILAYNLGLLESHNLWDYLLDPVFVLASAIAMVFGFAKRVLANRYAQ
jgi:hypothetical protein